MGAVRDVWWLWVDCGQAQDQPLRYVKWRNFRLYIKLKKYAKRKNNKKPPVKNAGRRRRRPLRATR